NGLVIAAAGTHPFSSWMEQAITPLERYIGVHKHLGELSSRLLIFGTHVHIGIEDRDFLIDAMNVARYFVPHVLTLSTSSPFWMGRVSALKSYRSVIFKNFPRTGTPPNLDSWNDFVALPDSLVPTCCVPDGPKMSWVATPINT